MPTKPTVIVTSTASQASNRYMDTFRDQHKSSRFPDGRPWWGWREFTANKGEPDGFVGNVIPGDHLDPAAGQWSAPWMPDAAFFEFNYRRSTIAIRYDRMLAHDRAAYEEYYNSANRIANQNTWPETRYGSIPRHSITSLIGYPPRSPKIAQAAMAGDRWLLGSSDEVNEELAQLLGLSRHGLKIMREEMEPVATPAEVLTMTPEQLQKLIAAEVAKAVANIPKRKHRRVNPLPGTDVAITSGKVA